MMSAILSEHANFERLPTINSSTGQPGHIHARPATPPIDPIEPDQPPPQKFRKISEPSEEENITILSRDPSPPATPPALEPEYSSPKPNEELLGASTPDHEMHDISSLPCPPPLSPLAFKRPSVFLGMEPPIWTIGGPCPCCEKNPHDYKTSSGFEKHCLAAHPDEDVFMEYRPTKAEMREWRKDEKDGWDTVLGSASNQEWLETKRTVDQVRALYEGEWKQLEDGKELVMRQVGRDFEGRVAGVDYGY